MLGQLQRSIRKWELPAPCKQGANESYRRPRKLLATYEQALRALLRPVLPPVSVRSVAAVHGIGRAKPARGLRGWTVDLAPTVVVLLPSMPCCAARSAHSYATSDPTLPPTPYCGRWVEDGGKSELRIHKDGKVCYKAAGTFVSNMTMTGWREPPDACDIQGRILCLWETFHLALLSEDILEVDGRRYSRGAPKAERLVKVDRGWGMIGLDEDSEKH